MKKLIVLILLVCSVSVLGQNETPKQKYQKMKAEYTELSNKTEFAFANVTQYTDRFKRVRYYSNKVTILSDSEAVNVFLLTVINDNSDILISKVKQFAAKRKDTLKAQYLVGLAAFKDSLEKDADPPGGFIPGMTDFKDLRKQFTAIQNLTDFSVYSDDYGFRIVGGFSKFNELLVTVLNDNLDLLIPKYRQSVQDEFTAKKAALKKEAEDLLTEIDK